MIFTIVVKDVFYSYPSGIDALKGVSMTLNKGEVVIIMGENGAGKTTLIKCLNGLIKPESGKVLVDGLDTKYFPVATLSKKVGIVFQNPDNQLFASNVYEEISFGLKNFNFAEKEIDMRAKEVLREFGLMRYVRVSPFSLSGGEKKRLALASILAWNPDYVVMDEPTLGQDQANKDKLRMLVNRLVSEGKGVLIATHDVEFASSLDAKFILMSKGKIVKEGNKHEVFTDIKSLTTCSLLPPQSVILSNELSKYGIDKSIVEVEKIIEELAKLFGDLS